MKFDEHLALFDTYLVHARIPNNGRRAGFAGLDIDQTAVERAFNLTIFDVTFAQKRSAVRADIVQSAYFTVDIENTHLDALERQTCAILVTEESFERPYAVPSIDRGCGVGLCF